MKAEVYDNITGTPVSNLYADPKYQAATPDRVLYLSGLTFGQPGFGGTVGDNYGVVITGTLTPPATGNYHFFVRSDDASQLYLNTTGPAIPVPDDFSYIAVEFDCCDAFQETTTGDLATTAAPVNLVAGQKYGFAFVVKEGGGGDWGQVAWRLETDTTPANQLGPIVGSAVSAVADAAGASVTITQDLQPGVSVPENDPLTLTVAADTTVSPTALGLVGQPTYQWYRNGNAIPSYGATYAIGRVFPSENGAKYKVLVMVPGAMAMSQETTVTVTADVTPPTIVGARGSSDLSTVTISFSEDMDPVSTTTLANYSVNPTLTLSNPQMIGTRSVQFTTSAQTLGTEYTITVNGVRDASTAANPVAANTEVKFRGIGPIQQRDDSFIVFEVELYDRLIGNLWRPNTTRGTRSGGVAMEMPDNVGDSEANDQILFDVNFVKTGTHYVWYRAWGPDGGGDSAWFHLDGLRPAERDPANGAAANSASMSGFNVGTASDFVWRSDSQDGPDPYTVEIATPGLHTIGIASREDGAIFDKMVISTNASYQPTGLGPNPTPRQGEVPPPPDLMITVQPASLTVVENRPATFTTAATTGDPALTYQWQQQQGASFQDIPGANSPTFKIDPATLAWNGAVLRCKVSIPGSEQFTDEVTLTVTADAAPPVIISAGAINGDNQVGIAFDETLDATSATTAGNYQVSGATVNSATLRFGRIVELTLAAAVSGNFTVTVTGVQDLAGNQVASAPVNGQLADLSAQDLGFPGADPVEPGDAFSWGTGFYVAAGGNDIWDADDAGYIVHKQFTGPFDMKARVDGLTNGDEWGKATLMVRETIDPGSRNQAVLITKNGPYPTASEPAPGPYSNGGVNVYNHQWRDTTDGTSGSKAGGERISPTVFPSWIRLVRESTNSNEIKSYISYDGQNWIFYHTHTTPDPLLAETVVVGMAVTSHDNAPGFAKAEAVYESFSVVPFQAVVDPNLRVAAQGSQVSISWDTGTLVSSSTVDGTYQPVANATSPHTITPTGTAMFFQVQISP